MREQRAARAYGLTRQSATGSLLTAGLLLIALACSPAAEAKTIATGSGTSFANASGALKRPKSLSFEVTTIGTGTQTVDVSWSVSCSGQRFKFDFRQGSVVGSTPLSQALPRPVRNPNKCNVSASALQSNFFVDPFVISVVLRGVVRPRR